MTPRAAVIARAAFALCTVLLIGQRAQAQDFINRRQQARGIFRASPEGIYRHYCAHCHGDDAKGTGRLWVSELSPSPTDLTRLTASEESVVAAIRDGSAAHGKSSLCPPWGRTLSLPDIQRLARYIISLGDKAAPAPSKPALPEPPQDGFPWVLPIVLAGEIALLWWMLRHTQEASNAIRQDPLVRG